MVSRGQRKGGGEPLLVSSGTSEHQDIALILFCASSTAGLNLRKCLKIRRYWLYISVVDSLSISIPICHSIMATVVPFLITQVSGDPWQVRKDSSSGLLIAEWLKLARTSGGHLIQHPCSSRANLEMAFQDCVQTTFEYIQGEGLHNRFQQPVPVVHVLIEHREQKTFLTFSPH